MTHPPSGPDTPPPPPGPKDRGEPDVYELTWQTGHIETVLAHQVAWPGTGMALVRAGMLFGAGDGPPEAPRRITFHAEIDGRWTLTLSAIEDDIRTIRLVTRAETIPGGAA